MSEHDNDTDRRARPRHAANTPSDRPRWWVGLAVFVTGLVAGVLLVGLLSAGTPDFVRQQADAASAQPTPGGAETVEVAAQARVNAACLRAINDAQDVYSILAGLEESGDDIDLVRLNDIVRQLQPVERRLQANLPACEVDTAISGEPGGSASPVVPSPTSTGR